MAPSDASSAGSGESGSESPHRAALRSFSSPWFLVPQGTGILAVTLWELDYQFRGLGIIAIILWALAIVTFLVFLVLYVLRAVCFPKHFWHMVGNDNSETACLACIPVTYSSLVQMLSLVLGAHESWGLAAYCLWWVGMGVSLLTILYVPFSFATINPPGANQLLPSSQLPVVAGLTCAAAGASICQSAGIAEDLKIPAIIVCYLLVGLSTPLAIFLDALFLSRLFNQPKQEKAAAAAAAAVKSHPTSALTLAYQQAILIGPWSQGSSALQSLGQSVAGGLFARHPSGILLTAEAQPAIGYFSMFAGLLLWGQAFFWWIFTLSSLFHAGVGGTRSRRQGGRPRAFQMACWSLVFPWGVFTHAAVQLGKLLDSAPFRVWSTILTIAMVVIWLVCMALTAKGCVGGSLLGLKQGWKRANSEKDEEHRSGMGTSSPDE